MDQPDKTSAPDSLGAKPATIGLKAEQATHLATSYALMSELLKTEDTLDEHDSSREDDEQKTSDYLTALLILQQENDGGLFGAMEWATEKAAEATENAGDVVQRDAEKAADAVENSRIIPESLRHDAANEIRGAGSLLNHGAHSAARAERQLLPVEHSLAQISGNYYENLARHESGNNPFARTPISKKTGKPISTAAGLYEFLEASWLSVVAQHGKAHGGALAEAAEHIHRGKRGYECDAGWREKILYMRHDRQLSTLMAQDFTNDNAVAVQKIIGNRHLNNGDLYIAHFMGAQGAAKMIIGLDRNPNGNAADLFPKEAEANPNIFYVHGNRAKPRSVAEVYALQTRDFMTNHQAANIQMASAAPSHANHSDLRKMGHTANNMELASASPAPKGKKIPVPGLSLGPTPPAADA